MEENNVLWLSKDSRSTIEDRLYIFSTDDPDSTDREPFNPVVANLMVELLQNYIPLIRMGYDVMRPSQKRRFRKDIPAVFSESCEAAKWEFLLKKTDWRDGFYIAREFQHRLNEKNIDEKELCIMPNSLDSKFLLKILEDPFYSSYFVLEGYPKQFSRMTEKDFEKCVQTNERSIAISPYENFTLVYINTTLPEYPEEKLIERTKRVAERHGKVLEVYT